MSTFDRKDVYSRVTAQIISDLEQGVRTWMKPWHAEYAAGRVTRPLRLKCERGERRIDLIELRTFCRAFGLSLGRFISALERAISKAK